MESNPSIPVFPDIFSLLEDGANTNPQSRMERLATLPLGERLPIVVCLEAPESHIRVIWGAQFVTPSFAQPTPEIRKVLAFARDIRLGLLPATVVVKPECLTLGEVNVPQASDLEDLIERLAPGHPYLPPDTQRPERVSAPWAYLTPSLQGPPSDGLPFPGAGNCVVHDAHKSRQHEDDPVGGTVPRLVEGGDSGSPAGHCCPHQCGPRRHHSSTATRYQDETHTPTTPYPPPNPNPPASAALTDISASPTDRSHEAGGDANRLVRSRPMEPPTSLQHQYGSVDTIYMEDGVAAKERPD